MGVVLLILLMIFLVLGVLLILLMILLVLVVLLFHLLPFLVELESVLSSAILEILLAWRRGEPIAPTDFAPCNFLGGIPLKFELTPSMSSPLFLFLFPDLL